MVHFLNVEFWESLTENQGEDEHLSGQLSPETDQFNRQERGKHLGFNNFFWEPQIVTLSLHHLLQRCIIVGFYKGALPLHILELTEHMPCQLPGKS
jgi:hypothetical protein